MKFSDDDRSISSPTCFFQQHCQFYRNFPPPKISGFLDFDNDVSHFGHQARFSTSKWRLIVVLLTSPRFRTPTDQFYYRSFLKTPFWLVKHVPEYAQRACPIHWTSCGLSIRYLQDIQIHGISIGRPKNAFWISADVGKYSGRQINILMPSWRRPQDWIDFATWVYSKP